MSSLFQLPAAVKPPCWEQLTSVSRQAPASLSPWKDTAVHPWAEHGQEILLWEHKPRFHWHRNGNYNKPLKSQVHYIKKGIKNSGKLLQSTLKRRTCRLSCFPPFALRSVTGNPEFRAEERARLKAKTRTHKRQKMETVSLCVYLYIGYLRATSVVT